jgi:hypothetical protein
MIKYNHGGVGVQLESRKSLVSIDEESGVPETGVPSHRIRDRRHRRLSGRRAPRRPDSSAGETLWNRGYAYEPTRWGGQS